MSKTESDQYDEFEEKKDELWDGLLRAYTAGYAKALDDFDVDVDVESPAEETLRKNDHVTESHYYFWNGQTLPLEFWLCDQFGLDTVRNCYCGGEREEWEYHTPEGCGDTAQAVQFVRDGRPLPTDSDESDSGGGEDR